MRKIRIFRRLFLLVLLLSGLHVSASADTLSTEHQVYDFLTRELELPTSAACGILANIEHESNFNVNALGDNGTSYGLCQWHAGRYTALKTYCQGRGLDYQTAEGQLEYLRFELETGYGSMLTGLRMMENNANGAYRAAYIWCIEFERPSDMENKAIRRGTLARGKYWNRYNSILVEQEEEPLTEEEVQRIIRRTEVTVPQPPEGTRVEHYEGEETLVLPTRPYIPRHRPKKPWHGDAATGFAVSMLFLPLYCGKKERLETLLPEPAAL